MKSRKEFTLYSMKPNIGTYPWWDCVNMKQWVLICKFLVWEQVVPFLFMWFLLHFPHYSQHFFCDSRQSVWLFDHLFVLQISERGWLWKEASCQGFCSCLLLNMQLSTVNGKLALFLIIFAATHPCISLF